MLVIFLIDIQEKNSNYIFYTLIKYLKDILRLKLLKILNFKF